MDVRVAMTVSGRVQDVGFRAWVRSHARAAGLIGSATNLPDGRVEVVAQGPRPACEQLLATVQGTDAPGAVGDVTTRWFDSGDDLDGFVLG